MSEPVPSYEKWAVEAIRYRSVDRFTDLFLAGELSSEGVRSASERAGREALGELDRVQWLKQAAYQAAFARK